ncbi:hypothetical protein RM779_14635 [Streptomyces sp. DSM 41886]|uniref:ABC transporter n=1 Tax=Streptomyces johnsoniae TaxID=3075532 RepID=A0ABU2S497_9ACTN|nr:hypothetical protein [Streptomyces sp. DSM 41886]MDT0443816.1 hypothetical protein [Streptomyces sp. DSM 41886]
MISSTTTRALGAVLAAGALLLTGCADGSDDKEEGEAPAEETTPHGYVEGAEETAEAQQRLVLAEADSGATAVLDLTTEEVVEVEATGPVTGIHGDGRFAYLASGAAGGEEVNVVDGGSWMVDHGDHVHYYKAEARGIGTLPGSPTGAHTDAAVTAVSFADGSATLLERAALEDGELAETGTVETAGPVVPYAEHLLVPAGGQDAVEVLDREGNAAATVAEPCPEPSGQAVTRRGVVFGCADGALLVSEEEGTFTGEKIPYPEGVTEAERAGEFTHRAGSDTLAARAGDTGVWTLDLASGTWTLIETGPVAAVNAVGDGATVLTLTEDGELHAYDSGDGRRTASTPLLAEPLAADGTVPVIEIDTSRAYVNDPAAGVVHEIDYNDDLRLARTFELGFAPDHMVETGR